MADHPLLFPKDIEIRWAMAMKVEVRLPTPLRAFVEGRPSLELEGSTVHEALLGLAARHPELRRRLFTADGELRSHLTVYRNEEDIRVLERGATPLRAGDVLTIVPSIAGGAPTAPVGSAPTQDPRFSGLSSEELFRYSRQVLLPEVGMAGQRRLRDSKVLIVGAGGLGSPAALYLAAAGVGEVGLVDFDSVDLSNLQRQILYGTPEVGHPKLAAASARLNELNPGVVVHLHEEAFTRENAKRILSPYDVVLDGTDNFPSRYLINDASALLGKPEVFGSVYRFEGQVTVFDARHGPCYRCLFPEPPPPEQVPSCAEGGVLGVLPGLIGVLQAVETLKLLLGVGEPLVGRLLLVDALSMQFRELKLKKSPECVLCGPNATLRELIDYPAFCGTAPTPGGDSREIGARDLSERLRSEDPPMLVDVREAGEWEFGHLPGAKHIPRSELAERLNELTSARELVLYCKEGARSARAAELLYRLGFTHVRNLRGGVVAWAREVDPSFPRY
jgi:adenylyltransferase/sulfurtransferase